MLPIYRTPAIRRLEQGHAAAHPGVSLMERAGLAAAERAREMLGDGYRVLVLCGAGNNGGDALVAARHLRQWDYRLSTLLAADSGKLPPEAAAAYQCFIAAGGETVAGLPAAGEWDLIVDGLLGIGLSRPVDGELAALIGRINTLSDSGVPVLAIDVPSGLDSDTGKVHGVAVRARATITFIGLKPGLLTGDGKDHCGEVSVAGLGIDLPALDQNAEDNAPVGDSASGELLDRAAIAAYLPRRKASSHKGTFGSVGILGGADGMLGAAALAAGAALKLGAGRVYVGTLAGLPGGYDTSQPELMWRGAGDLLAQRLTALVVGPGFGQSATARVLLARAIALPLPLLLDADALNLLATHEPLQPALMMREQATLLSPHPAEAARLLDSDTETVERDRVAAALGIAEHFQATVVLKGAGSVIALPDGRWFINPTGNPGMASAGMGDVLSGIIGALLAQGVGAAEAMQLGAYLHGAAADALVARGIGPVGLTAGETIIEARRLMNQWSGKTGADRPR